MRPCISIRGSVCPSIRLSVRRSVHRSISRFFYSRKSANLTNLTNLNLKIWQISLQFNLSPCLWTHLCLNELVSRYLPSCQPLGTRYTSIRSKWNNVFYSFNMTKRLNSFDIHSIYTTKQEKRTKIHEKHYAHDANCLKRNLSCLLYANSWQ